MDLEVDTSALHSLFVQSWSQRSSTRQWECNVKKILSSVESSDRVIIQYFIESIKEGNMCSSLLIEYLEYAIANHTIQFEAFFSSLWNAIQSEDSSIPMTNTSLVYPPKLAVLLKLLQKFFTSLRFESYVVPQSEELCIILIVFKILLTGISFSIDYLCRDDFDKVNQFSESLFLNIHSSLAFLSSILAKERFRGYLLLLKVNHIEKWASFLSLVEKIHTCFISEVNDQEKALPKLMDVQKDWIHFCHNMSRVLDISAQVVNHTGGNNAVISLQQNSLATGSSTSWHTLSFSLQYLMASRELKNFTAQCKSILESFKCMYHWKQDDFYAYIIASSIKTLSGFKKQGPSESLIATKAEWFLLSKLPKLFFNWEENAVPPPFYAISSELNHVEKAILYVCQFPELGRLKIGNQDNENNLLKRLMKALASRGLIDITKLAASFPSSSLEYEADCAFEMALLDNDKCIARKVEDVDRLEQLLTQESDLFQLQNQIKCLTRSLRTPGTHQELLVRSAIRIISSDRSASTLLGALLLQQIGWQIETLHIFHMNDALVELISGIAKHCEELGNQANHCSLFSSIFFSLVSIIDQFGIKEGSFNQSVFISAIQAYPNTVEWYSRYLHSFLFDSTSYIENQTCMAFLQGQINATQFVQDTVPWDILLALPIHVWMVYEKSYEKIKSTCHTHILDLCKTFLPAVLSFNEVYSCFASFLANSALTNSLIADVKSSVSPTEETKEAWLILEALENDSKREVSRGFHSESGGEQFVPDFEDNAPHSRKIMTEMKTLFSALVNNSISISHITLTALYALADAMGKREFVALILNVVMDYSPQNRVGHATAFALRAAELGGFIVGMSGAEYVAEYLTQNLPLYVPIIGDDIQAQMVASFTWCACCISQIFTISDEDLTLHYLPIVRASRIHCLLFFTELLERQCCAPSPLLALPITFISFLSCQKDAIQKFGSILRVASSLRKLHCTEMCVSLFDFSGPQSKDALAFYNVLE